MKKVLFFALSILMLGPVIFAQDTQKPEKLTAEDVVAKHLASIGTPADIAAAKSRVMVGTGRLSGKAMVTGYQNGPTQLASTGNMMLFAMIFTNDNYPAEKAAFDGKDVTIGKLPGGTRTLLGEFIKRQSGVMKEGLFTGALSSAWPLLDVAGKKVKLSYAGTTEMGGQTFYKLKYTSRVGEMSVFLYFDTNFHHVLSEYKFSVDVGASEDSTSGTGRKVERWTMTEQYSNFKTAGKLTLPFSYSINVTHVVETELLSYDWKVNIGDVYLNESLTPDVFKVS
jgi:hypothetical protein